MGALSSKSLQSSLPRSVSIVAIKLPEPESPSVASERVNFPFTGSSGATGTVATGRPWTLGTAAAGTGFSAGAADSAGVEEVVVLAGSSLAAEGSAGVDLQ